MEAPILFDVKTFIDNNHETQSIENFQVDKTTLQFFLSTCQIKHTNIDIKIDMIEVIIEAHLPPDGMLSINETVQLKSTKVLLTK